MRWLIPFLAACNGTVGTIALSLTTAPGSTVLDGASTLKVVVSNPHDVTTVQRSANGSFQLTIDLPATNGTASIIVDALDTNGDLVATGSSPPIPFGAIDTGVTIYMAKPMSFAAAPVSLMPAASVRAAGPLAFGAIFAGGLDATNAPTDTVTVYNAYDHSLAAGKALPAPRDALVLGVGDNGLVYLFGGLDATANPTSNLWSFDTKASPNGAYQDFGEKAGFARAGELALPIGNDQFVVTGAPPALLAGLDGSMTPITAITSIPPAGASVLGSDGMVAAVFPSTSGQLIRYLSGAVDFLPLPAKQTDEATVAALANGLALVACGGPDAVAIDVATGDAQVLRNTPSGGRLGGCAIAVTSRYVVIAGGVDLNGLVNATADILDATTLAFVATVPLVMPRNHASAIALPNGQVLIAGGATPTDTLELFTPDPIE